MVIGPFINAGAVLLGGVLGAVLSQRLPERIRVSMPSIFGLASLGIGILLVVKCANLPVMVLATLLGALIGEFCYLEKGINHAVGKAKNLIARPGKAKHGTHESFIQNYVAIIILFLRQRHGDIRFDAGRDDRRSQHIDCESVSGFLYCHHLCHHPRHRRRRDLRADVAYSTGAGHLRHADPAADNASDDGRLYRRRRPVAAGDRAANLWH